MQALASIFERVDVSESTASVTLGDGPTCRVSLSMPDDYPSTAPLEVTSIESEALSREARAELLARCRAHASSAVGEESAFGTLTMIEDGFRDAAEERKRRDDEGRKR